MVSVVIQLSGRALGKNFVMHVSDLKATPVTMYVWVFILQKP